MYLNPYNMDMSIIHLLSCVAAATESKTPFLQSTLVTPLLASAVSKNCKSLAQSVAHQNLIPLICKAMKHSFVSPLISCSYH